MIDFSSYRLPFRLGATLASSHFGLKQLDQNRVRGNVTNGTLLLVDPLKASIALKIATLALEHAQIKIPTRVQHAYCLLPFVLGLAHLISANMRDTLSLDDSSPSARRLIRGEKLYEFTALWFSRANMAISGLGLLALGVQGQHGFMGCVAAGALFDRLADKVFEKINAQTNSFPVRLFTNAVIELTLVRLKMTTVTTAVTNIFVNAAWHSDFNPFSIHSNASRVFSRIYAGMDEFATPLASRTYSLANWLYFSVIGARAVAEVAASYERNTTWSGSMSHKLLVVLSSARATWIIKALPIKWNLQDRAGQTILHVICVTNRAAYRTRGMIERVAANMTPSDLNKPNKKGVTPLHMACIFGNVEAVRQLLKREVDVNKPIDNKDHSWHQFTPLELACLNNNETIAKLLINAQADLNVKHPTRGHALSIAIGAGCSSSFLHSLLEKMAITPEEMIFMRTLIDCRSGNLEAIKNHLSNTPLEKLSLSYHNILKTTAFGQNQQQLDVLNYLCEFGRKNGINLNSANKSGETALHATCECGNEKAVKVLLSFEEIDPNVVDSQGLPPLYYAHKAKSHSKALVKLLEECSRLDTNSLGYKQVRFFDLFELDLKSHEQLLELYKKLGRAPDEIYLCQVMVESAINVNLPSYDGKPVLQRAAESGMTNWVLALLKREGTLLESTAKDGTKLDLLQACNLKTQDLKQWINKVVLQLPFKAVDRLASNIKQDMDYLVNPLLLAIGVQSETTRDKILNQLSQLSFPNESLHLYAGQHDRIMWVAQVLERMNIVEEAVSKMAPSAALAVLSLVSKRTREKLQDYFQSCLENIGTDYEEAIKTKILEFKEAIANNTLIKKDWAHHKTAVLADSRHLQALNQIILDTHLENASAALSLASDETRNKLKLRIEQDLEKAFTEASPVIEKNIFSQFEVALDAQKIAAPEDEEHLEKLAEILLRAQADLKLLRIAQAALKKYRLELEGLSPKFPVDEENVKFDLTLEQQAEEEANQEEAAIIVANIVGQEKRMSDYQKILDFDPSHLDHFGIETGADLHLIGIDTVPLTLLKMIKGQDKLPDQWQNGIVARLEDGIRRLKEIASHTGDETLKQLSKDSSDKLKALLDSGKKDREMVDALIDQECDRLKKLLRCYMKQKEKTRGEDNKSLTQSFPVGVWKDFWMERASARGLLHD